MNWDVFWNGWTALATSGLVVVTAVLVVWAARTFGQTKEAAARARKPHVSLWLDVPDTPQRYTPIVHAEQFLTYYKWQKLVEQRGLQQYIVGPTMVACWAYNLGQGPAVRIRVPYRLQVAEVLEDGSEAAADSMEGEFEIIHVPPNWWNLSRSYLDVTYYPKYRVELLLDRAEVTSLDETDVPNAVVETSNPVREWNNKASWDAVRYFREQLPPFPSEPPPRTPFLDALRGIEDKGEG